MYPTELPAAPWGGHPLSLATRWARDAAVMRQGSVTMMYGHCLHNCCRRRCSQMPSGGRQGSSLPPPPPSIESSSSSSSPPSPPGGIAGPALTCQIPSTPRVSPPRSHAWCMLSALCATMLVGNDGRPSAPTSGPCQRPPPPVRHPTVVAVVIHRRRVVPPPPPSNRCRYTCLVESSGLTAVAGSALLS